MQYQSFPDVRGDSRSLDKLKALRLPPLAGKHFLDVGCNEGFFCGYALHDGATVVAGIDRSREAIHRASQRFPTGRFNCQSWEVLPEGRFDVILLASALHYADDQAALIHRLMDALTDEGVLVLELGIANSNKKEWVSVQRSIDQRLFPSRSQLQEVLASYAWKIVGHSTTQAGDPVPRYVVHVRKLRPAVFLLCNRPGSGKSTLCRTVFAKSGLPVVAGDIVLGRIARGQQAAPDALQQLVKESFDTTAIARVTAALFAAGQGEALFDIWCQLGGERDFVVDAYLTASQEQAFKQFLTRRGYLPVTLNWEMEISMACEAEAQQRAEHYQLSLMKTPMPAAASRYQVHHRPASDISQQLHRWHLDGPRQGQTLDESVTVSGWVMPHDQQHLAGAQGYIDGPAGRREFAFNQPRPDVLASLQIAAEQCQNPCGFRLSLPAAVLASGAEIGVMLNGQALPLARVCALPTTTPSTPARKGWRRWIKRLTKAR